MTGASIDPVEGMFEPQMRAMDTEMRRMGMPGQMRCPVPMPPDMIPEPQVWRRASREEARCGLAELQRRWREDAPQPQGWVDRHFGLVFILACIGFFFAGAILDRLARYF